MQPNSTGISLKCFARVISNLPPLILYSWIVGRPESQPILPKTVLSGEKIG